MPNDIFVGWGRKTETQTPLSVDWISKYFTNLVMELQKREWSGEVLNWNPQLGSWHGGTETDGVSERFGDSIRPWALKY